LKYGRDFNRLGKIASRARTEGKSDADHIPAVAPEKDRRDGTRSEKYRRARASFLVA
jgi:hypothetical protein